MVDVYADELDDQIGGTVVIKAICSDATVGDVNGDNKSSTVDALLVVRSAIGLNQLDAANKINADTNFDGKVTAADALIIQRHAVGLVSDY